jgi:hypothetical protein
MPDTQAPGASGPGTAVGRPEATAPALMGVWKSVPLMGVWKSVQNPPHRGPAISNRLAISDWLSRSAFALSMKAQDHPEQELC